MPPRTPIVATCCLLLAACGWPARAAEPQPVEHTAPTDEPSLAPPQEETFVELLEAGHPSPERLKAALERLPADPGRDELLAMQRAYPRLIALDGADAQRLANRILLALVATDEEQHVDFVAEAFERYPEERHHAAYALARYARLHRRRWNDWHLLVRSLTVVEGRQAREVLRALLMFPHRATKPRWIRHTILHGLQQPDEAGKVASLQLLQHWAGKPIADAADDSATQLEAWQAWFSATYPDQPLAELPRLPDDARWSLAELRRYVYSRQGRGDAQRGAEVFDKADCRKCHRYGARGEAIGPDLTDIRGRMQRREMIESLLFPSEVVSDQYETYVVVTTSGLSYTGVVGPAGADTVAVLQPNGEKVTLRRDEIASTQRSSVSAMPSGALDRLTLEQIADLLAYLTTPPAGR